jgi:4-amino-4-deoxy-L-arabinose transferase-like glycosyltransferase
VKLTRDRLVRSLPLALVVGLAGLLNSWALLSVGWGNAYYSAAVRSMSMSWKNFFFVSLDPKGFVSVDKAPLSLWVQALSARLFGFSQASVLIPHAVAGTLTVLVLGLGIQKVWGRTAGVLAALCLALTPIHVMVSHSNNTDAVLVFVMTLGAVLTLRAIQSGRLRSLLLACVVAGSAVTTKMLAGLPIVVAVLVGYVWCAPRSWKIRVGHGAAATVVLTVSALWWFAVVDLTPKDSRPYVGSSSTNSTFQLAFERNGTSQVDGTQALGGRGGPGGRSGPGGLGALGRGGLGGARGPGGRLGGLVAEFGGPGGPGGFGGPGGPQGMGLGFMGGSPGVLRLFNEELGSEVSWMLPFALLGGLIAAALLRLRPSAKFGSIVVFGGWFVIAAVAFSKTEGIVHPYYTSNVGPPIAALVAIGAVSVAGLAGRRRALLSALMVMVTLVTQVILLRRPSLQGWHSWLIPVIVVAGVAGVGVFALRRSVSRFRAAAMVLPMAIAPAALIQTSLAHSLRPELPYASVSAPTSIGGGLRPNGGFTFPAGEQELLVKYLRANRKGATWEVAVQSAGQAESLIIEHGVAVMAMGGFIGSDPILTEKSLRAKIAKGEVRYFMVSSGGFGGMGRPGGFGGPVGGGLALDGAQPGVQTSLDGSSDFGGLLPGVNDSSDLSGLLPGQADQNGSSNLGGLLPAATPRPPLGGAGVGGFPGFPGMGGIGSSPSSFVASECREVPTEEWQSQAPTVGVQSFPGGPTSAGFKLYDCAPR